MPTTRATGFFGRAVGESDRDGFIGLKVNNSGLIGPFKEGSDPIFGVYVALTVAFGFVSWRAGFGNRWGWDGFVVGFVTVVGRQVAIRFPVVASPTPVLVAPRA
jgi:hypothetical protein